MKNYFAANKFKLAYTFLILAFIIAACNYPVTQEESAGDVIKWNVDRTNTEAIKKIENMEWFRTGQYNVNDDQSGGKSSIEYQYFVTKENHDRMKDYKKQLESIAGVTDLKIISLNETVKRPVYSALLNNLFKIDINATNMSNEELSKEISNQLKNAGIENANVSFERNQDGERRIRLEIPEHELKKDGGFDMTIKDGNNVNRIKEFRSEHKDGKEADRFKHKSDDEIRNMVREDIGDASITDDQIEIKRDGDKVMVTVKKKRDGEDKKLEFNIK